MATRANINLDFADLRKHYVGYDQPGPVKTHFDAWREAVKKDNEKRVAEGKPPNHVPTSCCFQMCHALNGAGQNTPSSSHRRANATIKGGNGYYIGAVDELEHYLSGRYGPTEDIAGKGDWKARIAYLKTLKVPGLLVMRDRGYGFHTELWDGENILQRGGINFGTMSPEGIFKQPKVLFWSIGAKAETPIPEWLKGWWSVYDGEQYYYFFSDEHGCYYTKVAPTAKKRPTEKDPTNEAAVTVSATAPHVVLDWDGGTQEKFTQLPTAPPSMSGTSNRYGALKATKL